MPRSPIAGRATRALRRAVPSVVALVVAVAAIATVTVPAEAGYRPRVVIVVGPSGSATHDYLSHARAYARLARARGASVATIYTPNATWSRVVKAAQGANIFIYLGHGNGWPSPYRPWQTRTKDGLGLNPSLGSGNMRVKYYGEAAVAASIRLAPGAIVLLNRLCYASGSAEPGMAQPKWRTAVRRVDNYAAGFLHTGAAAVIADGHTSLAYELPALFGPDQLVTRLWTRDPDANGHVRSFNSRRIGTVRTHLYPDQAGTGFYRSLALRPGARSGAIRIAALSGTVTQRAVLRAAPDTGRVLATIPHGQRVFVRGVPREGAAGRTWTPITTRRGQAGWIAGWLLAYDGTALTRKQMTVRAAPSLDGARRGVVKEGRRVQVLRSRVDSAERVWLKVTTPRGRTGWIAGWHTQP